MFEDNQILARRAVLERLYTDRCTIYKSEEYTKTNGATAMRTVKLCENQPCRLSHSSNAIAVQGVDVATAEQSIKLFLCPEVKIKAGAIVDVTHAGETTRYNCAGRPAVYDAHQQIELKAQQNEC